MRHIFPLCSFSPQISILAYKAHCVIKIPLPQGLNIVQSSIQSLKLDSENLVIVCNISPEKESSKKSRDELESYERR